jgi:hypothetical protein
MKTSVSLAAFLAISLLAAGCSDDESDADDGGDDASPPASDAAIVVDARVSGDAIRRGLLGWHDWQPWNLPLEKIRAAGEGSRVSYWRVCMDDLVYDCETESFDPASLQEYTDWMDTIQSIGAEPLVSLDSVPSCMGYNSEVHTYPIDDAAYARFLAVFLDTFVSGRIAAGKAPLRFIESWNEPDSPFGAAFDGTIDDFLMRVFVPLGLAIQAEKARSGVELQFGGTATVSGFAFRDIDPDSVRILQLLRPDLPPWLCRLLVDLANMFLAGQGGVDAILGVGGFRWTDRMVEVADAAGFDLDYVSWHTYLNNPLGGDISGQPIPDDIPLHDVVSNIFRGRNPLANIAQFEVNARRWRERYPGKKLLVTEWGIAAWADSRWGTYDDAAFHAATLIAMQRGGVDGSMALSARDSLETVWYPHWYFDRMADRTVRTTMRESSEKTGVWALASFDEDAGRLTLLAAQWLTFAENAARLPIDVDVFGLPPGRYEADLYRIDRDHPGSLDADATLTIDVPESGPATLELPLEGDAVAFVDVRKVAGGR